jgi:hypothetical protein
MKKKLYSMVAGLLVFAAASAQISLNPKVKSVERPREETTEKTAMSVMTNSSADPADSMITWKIVDFDVPTGWQFDFCDPYDCISNLQLNSTNTFKLKIGLSGPLKGNFYSNSIGGTGTVKIAIQVVGKPETMDTLTLIAKAWSVGLNKVRNAADISLYPSPARNEITFKYPVTRPVEVAIYNVLGSKVKTFVHSGNETLIDLSGLQKGMYFIRLTVGETVISKSFTKAE